MVGTDCANAAGAKTLIQTTDMPMVSILFFIEQDLVKGGKYLIPIRHLSGCPLTQVNRQKRSVNQGRARLNTMLVRRTQLRCLKICKRLFVLLFIHFPFFICPICKITRRAVLIRTGRTVTTAVTPCAPTAVTVARATRKRTTHTSRTFFYTFFPHFLWQILFATKFIVTTAPHPL